MQLILFSGLAADSNVFSPQKLAYPQLIVPAWPTPEPNETLDSYCDRLADITSPNADSIIGGASFGGIIALHVAQRCNPAAVILIGSVRTPWELPFWIRHFRPLQPLVPLIPVRLLKICCAPFATRIAKRWFRHPYRLARQFRGSDPVVLKWSIERILDWKSIPNPNCPIFHIHGDRDIVLPIRNTNPDAVVNGGGHVISLSHANQVNAFLDSTIAKIMGEQCVAPKTRK